MVNFVTIIIWIWWILSTSKVQSLNLLKWNRSLWKLLGNSSRNGNVYYKLKNRLQKKVLAIPFPGIQPNNGFHGFKNDQASLRNIRSRWYRTFTHLRTDITEILNKFISETENDYYFDGLFGIVYYWTEKRFNSS